MKILRPRHVCALRAFFSFAGPALVAASAALLLLVAPTAQAATHSHPRRASARPLPASSFIETSSRATSRRRKGSSGQHSAGVSPHRSNSSATRTRAGKAAHGRTQQRSGPAAERIPIVPMSRASRRSAHSRASYARNEAPTRSRHHGSSGRQTAVAEVIGRSRNGDYLARVHTRRSDPRARYGSREAAASAPVVVAAPVVRAATAARSSGLTTDDFLHAAGDRGAAPSGSAAGVYAEGVSHPDDDERLPRRQSSGDAEIGTAQAIPAPHTASVSTPHAPQAQFVSGFGGEVAIAAPRSGDRPGGTHRRNHPIAPSALPEDAAPVSLEEREAITDAAVRPSVLPVIYDRSGRLVMPAPLKGSHEVLLHQNTMATSEGLERIQDDGELDRLRAQHQLISFPVSESLRVNDDLPSNRRYARPWTVLFAQDIARDFYARFRQPLQVNSAVRTVSYQLRLQRVNGNAAAADGDGASPHLTGQAIDLGKRGMSSAELAWMRAYLLPLMQAGKIDVEEEFQQACFHISVYRPYAFGRHPARELAQVNNSSARRAGSPASPTSTPPTPDTATDASAAVVTDIDQQ